MGQRLWNKDFTLVVVGQIISLFGNAILRFALNVYVLSLSGSAAVFGSIAAISMIPSILLSPIGGLIADRINRKDIMVALDFLTSALIVGFALLLSENNAIPLITLLLVLLAIIHSFYTPSVQTSVPLLQEGDNLLRGNAIVNQISMLATLLGPILGGMLYGYFGIQPIIMTSAFCFFFSAVLELFIHIPGTTKPFTGNVFLSMKEDFAEGIHYVRTEQPDVLKVSLTAALINLFLSPLLSISLSFCTITLLGLPSEYLGFANAALGAGGLLGGLFAGAYANRLHIRDLHLFLIGTAACLLPVAAAFAVGVSSLLTYALMSICYALFMFLAAILNIQIMTALQQRTPQHLLGKVFSIVTTLAMVAQPIGNAFYGVMLDLCRDHVYLVMSVAIIAAVLIATASKQTFARMDSASESFAFEQP